MRDRPPQHVAWNAARPVRALGQKVMDQAEIEAVLVGVNFVDPSADFAASGDAVGHQSCPGTRRGCDDAARLMRTRKQPRPERRAASAFVVAGSGMTSASQGPDYNSSRRQIGLRSRKRKTPSGSSDDSSNSQPVVWQKCSKSLTAPGSVASTSSTAPGANVFNTRRAFNTGNGHKSPFVSRMVAAPVASVMVRAISEAAVESL